MYVIRAKEGEKFMKKTIAALLTASLLLSGMAGCARKTLSQETTQIHLEDVQSGNTKPANSEELRKAYSEFVFGVMKHCAEMANGKNVMISSDSLLFALEMAAAGADGKTLDEMLNTMIPGADKETAFQFAIERMHALESDSLKIANSAWLNQRLAPAVREEYLNYIKKELGSQVQNIPFDDQAVPTINSWVNEKTDGMIPSLIDNVDPDTELMVLINAICFDSKWETGYDDSDVVKQEFHQKDGQSTDVDFLRSDEKIYVSNGNAQGFIKPYEGGEFGFMAILPNDQDVDINRLMADLTSEEYWKLWESQSTDYKVKALLPEFSGDYKAEMIPILQSLGMHDAFTANADFSKMTDTPAFISQVIHKTHIEVNREGTRAAAATAITIRALGISHNSNERFVTCDRPFAYAIVDMNTGLPVFLGTVETVK